MVLEYFNSGDLSELVTGVVVTGPNKPYIKTKLYKIKLNDVKAGDLMQVQAYGELTNSYAYNIMLAWQILLSTGEEVTEGKGYNVTVDGHHGNFLDATAYKFLQDYDSVEVGCYVWCASSQANGTQHLTVEQDYGNLNGILFRMSI